MSERLAKLETDQLRAILVLRSEFVVSGDIRFESYDFDLPTENSNTPGGPASSNASTANRPKDPLPDTSSGEIFDEIRTRQKAIYGDDDRIEVSASSDATRISVAKSVAAVVRSSDFMAINDTQTSIPATTLADKYALHGKPLCNREPFRSQPASAIGSAFLIGPSTVATAHHCINEGNYDQVQLVFDFVVDADGSASTVFELDQIYSVDRYIGGHFSEDAADWSVVELDRPVSDRLPLQYRREGKAPDGTPLYVIGHPLGLPKKLAGNAQIRINTHADYFVANLDTYGGNSGSPVLNAITHEVEGILVRGQADFAPLGNCYASLVCPVGGCRGEDCSRAVLLNDIVS